MSLIPPDAARPRSTRSWSIAGRLSRVHAWKTLLLVAATGSVLYWGLGRELRNQDAKLVASKLAVLEHLVTTYPLQSEAVRSEVEHEAGEVSPLRYYLRILDSSGRIELETPGMSLALPVSAFPALPAPTDSKPRGDDCVASADGRYLLASWSAAGFRSGGRIGLQVALDVTRTADVLSRYRWFLGVVLGIAVVVSALSSMLVARLAVRPLHDIAGRVRAITANRLDLPPLSSRPWPSELDGLARDFDAMLERLQDAFSRLSQFAADLAHALRNPINNLRGSAEVALSRPRGVEEYQQTLGSSLEELDRLSRLIDGLLFIARSEDPRQAIEHSTFPLRPELDAVREFYEALSADRGVQVRCDGDATIVGDPMLVRRAISNLLANALRHTSAGGVISMEVSQTPRGGACVAVRDSGSGIADAHLPFIFERFYRAHESGSSDGTGFGLGLAIVRSVMRLHGGDAQVTSQLGVGTTVLLDFPDSTAAAAPAARRV